MNVPTLTFLRKLPEITRVPVGKDVELVVELSRADVEVKWLREKEVIKKTTRTTTVKENTVRKLIIKKVTHEDEFEYTCTVEDIKTSTKLIAEGELSGERVLRFPRFLSLENYRETVASAGPA